MVALGVGSAEVAVGVAAASSVERTCGQNPPRKLRELDE
jgi:hypothetical protein